MNTFSKNIAVCLVTTLLVGSTFGQIYAQSNPGGQDNRNPVRICHATDSHTNPYTNPTVDQDSVDGDLGNDRGQGDHYREHNGPVWAEGIDDHSWGDIIPPIEGVHEGKNWNEAGQAFWNNSCNRPGEVEPSPSVDPSPSVQPSPSPEATPPTGGESLRHGTSLANDNLQCSNKEFDAVFDVFDHGNPVNNVTVKFTFNGTTKEVKTNVDGRARVQFPIEEGTVTATADGYQTQSMTITKPVGCPTVHLDPNKSRGQVLGASTMATTGSSDLVLAQLLATAGSLVTLVGVFGLRRV